MTLSAAEFPDWLAHRAATTPARVALVAGGRAWSFAELDADVTRLALRLRALGIRPGDRVATLLHNGAAPALLVHALPRLGATLVPLNIRLGDGEIAWQVSDAAPRLLVVEPRTAALAERACREAPSVRVAAWEALFDADAMDRLPVQPFGDASGRNASHLPRGGGPPEAEWWRTQSTGDARGRDPSQLPNGGGPPAAEWSRMQSNGDASARDSLQLPLGGGPPAPAPADHLSPPDAIDGLPVHRMGDASARDSLQLPLGGGPPATAAPVGSATRDPLPPSAADQARQPSAHEPVASSAQRSAQRSAARAHAAASAPPADAPLRLVHPADHVLAIIYTSGTTGRPKGAMLTMANFWWSAIGSALNLGAHADDRWLAVLPLFHVGGLSILLRAAIYGITAVVHDGFSEAAVNHAITHEGVTIVSVVAVTLQRMLDANAGRPYPATLRCVLLGGGPAPRPLLERCAAANVPVVQTYGLTETASQVATLAPEDALRKLGSAGRALYPNEVRIAARGGDDAGEILVRGPVVMAGYAGRPDDTARAVVDGWLHTGDVGRMDDDGFLYVLDRRDDLIITGGENVYPAEVEAALLAHPLVAEAGVIGMADDRWGQRVVAIVRLTSDDVPGTAADMLREHCRARLAAYKSPSEVRVVRDPLPRTASGKLRRVALRELVARG